MKKWGSLLVILILIIVITSPLWIWYLKPKNAWRIRVVDMTAPHPNYREHESLFWVFKHNKVMVPGEDRLFREDVDYIGYYPELSNYEQRRFTTRRLTREDLVGIDMLYLSDAYGVYVGDYEGYHGEEWIAHLDYSPLIYGGFDDEESQIIETFSQSGRAVVGEFNSFAEPTHMSARERLQKLFGLEWSGWVGRFFEDLADTKYAVPHWAPRLWRIHYNEEWKFKGPGWLFVHEDTRIFVLEEPSEAAPFALKIKDIKEDPVMKDVFGDVPFHTWFDVNKPLPGTEVLANYHLNVTKKGKEELDKFGIPTIFPCVARASSSPLVLYLAGDFSDLRPPEAPYFVSGYPWFKRIGRFSEHYRDQTAFYWQFYVTLMSNILDQPIPKVGALPEMNFVTSGKSTTPPPSQVSSPPGDAQERFAPSLERPGGSVGGKPSFK